MSSPLGPLSILFLYFLIIYYGKKYWKSVRDTEQIIEDNPDDNKAKKIPLSEWKTFKSLLFIYNCLISLLNAWIAYELIINGIENEYNFFCELVYPYTDNVHENRVSF